MKWYYDACGEYTIYKNYVIIKQEHPKLDKYAIYYESREKYYEPILVFLDTASSLEEVKDTVNKRIKDELAKKNI